MKTFGPGGSFGSGFNNNNPLNPNSPAGRRRNGGGYYMMKQQDRMRQQQQQRMWQRQQLPSRPIYQQTKPSYSAPYQSVPIETGRSGKGIFFIILAIILFVLFV